MIELSPDLKREVHGPNPCHLPKIGLVRYLKLV